MQIVIFTYDRKKKLNSIVKELRLNTEAEIIIIDDGSKYSYNDFLLNYDTFYVDYIRFPHTGKKGFYKKWDFAIDYCLASEHDDFLFLPDDITDLNIPMIQKLINQGWKDSAYAVNVSNDGRESCWGKFSTGQSSFDLGDTTFKEVGFVDCGFLSNRYTMSQIKIDRVQDHWFDRPDKSSGVGHQLTNKMRKLGAKMLMPTPSLCYHGDHESKMHKEHRKNNPLITR